MQATRGQTDTHLPFRVKQRETNNISNYNQSGELRFLVHTFEYVLFYCTDT